MDPTGVIVGALVSGAVAALKDTAGSAVKDAYQAIRTLLLRKFEKDPEGKAALSRPGQALGRQKKALERAVSRTRAYEDKQILAAAKRLSKLVEEQNLGEDYSVNIKGSVKGLVQGRNVHVTMNFDESAETEPPKKKK